MASKRGRLLKYLRLYATGTYGNPYWTLERTKLYREICNGYGLDCIFHSWKNSLTEATYDYFKEPYNDANYDPTVGMCKVLNCPYVDDILEMCEKDSKFKDITDRFIEEVESSFDFEEEQQMMYETAYRSLFPR